MTLVRAEDVSKTYMSGEVEVQALKGLSFEIEPASASRETARTGTPTDL